MESTMRLTRLLVLTGAALIAAGCSNPRSEAAVAQALDDAANEIGGLKNDIAMLQNQVDSLRTIVAKQDTNIVHIAAVNNVPISR
jgi:hypothetical protein